MTTELSEISVPVWFSNGIMMVRRDSLEPEHHESRYNYIARTYNVDPEDFGVPAPKVTKCPCCGWRLEDN